MVVLEHDERVVVDGVDGGQDLVGEHAIDADVAAAPGVPDLLGDVRGARGVPQIVLQEPEERVADDVVVLVVALGSGHDEAEAELGRVAELDQLLAVLGGLLRPLPITLGHGRGDPDRLPIAGDGADRGDDAAAALARVKPALGSAGERHRTPVGRDDERLHRRAVGGLRRRSRFVTFRWRGGAIGHDLSFRERPRPRRASTRRAGRSISLCALCAMHVACPAHGGGRVRWALGPNGSPGGAWYTSRSGH